MTRRMANRSTRRNAVPRANASTKKPRERGYCVRKLAMPTMPAVDVEATSTRWYSRVPAPMDRSE